MKKQDILVFILLTIAVLFQSSACFNNELGDRLEETKNIIQQETFICPDGYKNVIERWGLSGYSRYCLKNGVRHGKWIAFENKKLVIEGSYKEGKKDGQWIWYHNDGRVFKIVEYKEEYEVANKIINKK